MNKALFVLPATAFVFACVGSYNAVHMEMNNGNQVFVGETLENIGSSGEFTISSADGITCEGEYSFKTKLTGKGDITCSNKQKGTFVFASERKQKESEYALIKGYGKFANGDKFSITFGEVAPKYAPQPQSYQPQPIYEGQPPQYKGQLNIPLD